MTLKKLSSLEYLSALCLDVDDAGLPTPASLADMCRRAVWRWGICPRATLTKFVLERLRAGRLDDEGAKERLKEVIATLIEFGDLVDVWTAAGKRIARAQACWIRLDDGVAVVSGTLPSSVLGPGFESSAPNDLARRFDPGALTALVALREHGVRERSLSDWLGALGYVRWLNERGEGPYGPIESLWKMLEEEVDSDGVRLSNVDGVWALGGDPGQFFGRAGGDPGKTGRWVTPEAEGCWLAKRAGYGEQKKPLAISVSSSGETRGIDLNSDGEFGWAMIARGCALGEREVISARPVGEDYELQVSFPLPVQVRRLMRLFGVPSEERPWSWSLRGSLLPVVTRSFSQVGVDVID